METDRNLMERKSNLIKLRKLKPTVKFRPKNILSAPKENQFPCSLCEKQFFDQEALKTHFREHGSLETVRRVAYTHNVIFCEYCKAASADIAQAIKHKFRHHPNKRNYNCEFCGSLFPIIDALNQHKEAKHQAEMNTRAVCEPTIVRFGKAEKSESVPTASTDTRAADISKFKCILCPATFITVNALEYHQKAVHFLQLDLLQPMFIPAPSTKIKVNHNGEGFSVYYCHLCGVSYCILYNFKTHLRRHHTAEERNNLPKDGIIRCNLCEAVFYTKIAYDAHSLDHREDDLYVLNEEHRKRVVKISQDFDYSRIPTIGLGRTKRKLSVPLQAKPEKVEKEMDSNYEAMSPPSPVSVSSGDEDDRTKN